MVWLCRFYSDTDDDDDDEDFPHDGAIEQLLTDMVGNQADCLYQVELPGDLLLEGK